jgi:hypothetical protein
VFASFLVMIGFLWCQVVCNIRIPELIYSVYLWFQWPFLWCSGNKLGMKIRIICCNICASQNTHGKSTEQISRFNHLTWYWVTMLQVGRSRNRIPMRSLVFFNWPNSSSRILPPYVSRLSRKCGNLNISNPMGLHGLLQDFTMFLLCRVSKKNKA